MMYNNAVKGESNMKNAKCTNCGANIEVDEKSDAGICPYCKSAYITEKAVSLYSNTTTNNAGVINNYYTQPSPQVQKVIQLRAEPRPKINVGLAILGFIFYIFPGVLYIAYVRKKQDEWDSKYSI